MVNQAQRITTIAAVILLGGCSHADSGGAEAPDASGPAEDAVGGVAEACQVDGRYEVERFELVEGACDYEQVAEELNLLARDERFPWALVFVSEDDWDVRVNSTACRVAATPAFISIYNGVGREQSVSLEIEGDRLRGVLLDRTEGIDDLGESCDAAFEFDAVRVGPGTWPEGVSSVGGRCSGGFRCNSSPCVYHEVRGCESGTCFADQTGPYDYEEYCSASCRTDEQCPAGFECRPHGWCGRDVPICGDGDVEGDEVCDDGNTEDGDACSRYCTTAHMCGDRIQQAHEACDDGNTIEEDDCSADCLTAHVCGDGILAGREECDPPDAGETTPCSDTCALDPPPGLEILSHLRPTDELDYYNYPAIRSLRVGAAENTAAIAWLDRHPDRVDRSYLVTTLDGEAFERQRIETDEGWGVAWVYVGPDGQGRLIALGFAGHTLSRWVFVDDNTWIADGPVEGVDDTIAATGADVTLDVAAVDRDLFLTHTRGETVDGVHNAAESVVTMRSQDGGSSWVQVDAWQETSVRLRDPSLLSTALGPVVVFEGTGSITKARVEADSGEWLTLAGGPEVDHKGGTIATTADGRLIWFAIESDEGEPEVRGYVAEFAESGWQPLGSIALSSSFQPEVLGIGYGRSGATCLAIRTGFDRFEVWQLADLLDADSWSSVQVDETFHATDAYFSLDGRTLVVGRRTLDDRPALDWIVLDDEGEVDAADHWIPLAGSETEPWRMVLDAKWIEVPERFDMLLWRQQDHGYGADLFVRSNLFHE